MDSEVTKTKHLPSTKLTNKTNSKRDFVASAHLLSLAFV
jgi:hypothetical protein